MLLCQSLQGFCLGETDTAFTEVLKGDVLIPPPILRITVDDEVHAIDVHVIVASAAKVFRALDCQAHGDHTKPCRFATATARAGKGLSCCCFATISLKNWLSSGESLPPAAILALSAFSLWMLSTAVFLDPVCPGLGLLARVPGMPHCTALYCLLYHCGASVTSSQAVHS